LNIIRALIPAQSGGKPLSDDERYGEFIRAAQKSPEKVAAAEDKMLDGIKEPERNKGYLLEVDALNKKTNSAFDTKLPVKVEEAPPAKPAPAEAVKDEIKTRPPAAESIPLEPEAGHAQPRKPPKSGDVRDTLKVYESRLRDQKKKP
jgi:hypothetical protein